MPNHMLFYIRNHPSVYEFFIYKYLYGLFIHLMAWFAQVPVYVRVIAWVPLKSLQYQMMYALSIQNINTLQFSTQQIY